ncbi:uncharacterized protein LOC123528940 isoform X2 [Mercenaria mercenaria]|nr:uncharacterized protein LOC123528940 isoform X2 [Mercenaria mercenaria]
MALPGFVLGFISAVLLLITLPKLYIKLRCHGCPRSQESILGREEAPGFVDLECTDARTNHYMEIDEKKTRTFATPKQAISRTKADASADTSDGQRYEKCIVGNSKTHRYSDIKTEGSSTSKTQNASTTNSYEPFSPGNPGNKQKKRVSNHEYFILEPGSDKRLPVKPFESKSDTLPFDPGHVYFKLEPGTSKVTPVFQNTMKDTSSSNGRDSGHIYFVLEPMAESADSENLAYAVNDVATSSSFFILEKDDHC